MKTPEEMAEEYADNSDERRGHFPWRQVKDSYLAGYQAAKDKYKVAIDTYNDVAKQMLQEAVRIMSPKDRRADADKVMCNTTMEEIKAVDTGELMPITNLPTSAKWISVKERLPEYDHFVLLWHPDFKRQFVGCRVDSGIIDPLYWWQLELDMHEPDRIITHWMPLPNPPEEK